MQSIHGSSCVDNGISHDTAPETQFPTAAARAPKHDALVCGIDPDDPAVVGICPGCRHEQALGQQSEATDLLARWPHLRRPGPQPENQIAGTLAGQLWKVFGPAGAPEWTGVSDICPPDPPAPDPGDVELERILRLFDARPEAAAALRRILLLAERGAA